MILRTELRRSAAPVLAVGFVAVALGLFHGLSGPWGKGTAPWTEQWTGLARWPRYLMLFLWPLVLGAGAWQGSRDRRSGVRELLATTPRPAWRRAVPLLGALVLGLLAGYGALLVVGAARVAGHASYVPPNALPVVGVLALALAATVPLGVGIGRLLPSLLTPPVVAVLALALQIAAGRVGWPTLLTPAFEAPDIGVFTAVAPAVSLAQAVWFTGLGAAGFVLTVAVRALARLGALLPVAVAAGVAVPVLSTVDSVTVPDPAARALVCAEEVCVTRAHADYLSTLVGPARSALAALASLPRPPQSVVEVLPGQDFRRPPAGTVPVFVVGDLTGVSTRAPTEPALVERAVVANALAPPCATPGADWETQVDDAVARAVATAWVTGSLGPVPGQTYLWEWERDRFERAWRVFRALPAAEQRTRVLAVRAAAEDCRSRLLSLVVGR